MVLVKELHDETAAGRVEAKHFALLSVERGLLVEAVDHRHTPRSIRVAPTSSANAVCVPRRMVGSVCAHEMLGEQTFKLTERPFAHLGLKVIEKAC